MKARTLRPRPPRHHVEAYPRIDVREARKQVLREHHDVVWRDERGTVWGEGRASIEGAHLVMHSRFRSLLSDRAREKVDIFSLDVRQNTDGASDCFTKCETCGDNKRVLVLKEDTWACRICKQLSHRSMMIGQVARQTEQLAELEALVGDGRPKGMHETTFQNHRFKLAELKLLMADIQLTPSLDYAAVISTYWLAEGLVLEMHGRPYTGKPPADQ